MKSSNIPIKIAPNLKGTAIQHSIFEVGFYLSVVLINIFYMLYQVYRAGEEYFDEYFLDLYNDFSPGWSLLNRNKDIGDSEWILGVKVIYMLVPFIFVHLIVSECLKKYEKPEFIPLWHIATGMVFILKYLGRYSLLLFFIQPLIYYLIVQIGSRKIIWFTTVLLLILQHYVINLPETKDNKGHLDDKEIVDITVISLAWTNLRCVNFFLDATEDKRLQKMNFHNIINLLSYLFYLPLMYHGPIVLHSNFRSSRWYSSFCNRTPFTTRIISLGFQLLRYSIWWIFMELMLHYLYVNSMLYHIDLLKSMNYHALYGVGYLMGQLFHMKYVVFYGLSCCITNFELECPVPQHPKCISRIHLYSDMWKNFDQGLYSFMVKYIYKPCAKEAGKLIASLICFTFVFIWHGLYPHVLIWSLLNYIGVSIESFGRELIKFEELAEIDETIFRRIKCLCASPLLLMSAIAFFFYHGGKEVGDVFVQKMLFGSPIATLVTLFVLYCYCQVCTEVDILEKQEKPLIPPIEAIMTPTKQKDKLKIKGKIKYSKQDKDTSKQQSQTNPLAKAVYFQDKLIKFRSTGQINESPSKKFKDTLHKNEIIRRKTPAMQIVMRRPDTKPTYWKDHNINEISPMTFVEEYIQAKAAKPPIPPKKEDIINPIQEKVMQHEGTKSQIDHSVVDSTNVESSSVDDPNDSKKKDIFTRIDTLYKTTFQKDKKRKLWNLDRKNQK